MNIYEEMTIVYDIIKYFPLHSLHMVNPLKSHENPMKPPFSHGFPIEFPDPMVGSHQGVGHVAAVSISPGKAITGRDSGGISEAWWEVKGKSSIKTYT